MRPRLCSALIAGKVSETAAKRVANALSGTIAGVKHGFSLLLFSRSEWLPLSLAILPVVGASFVVHRSVNNTVLLMVVPDEMRGRVTSILTMDNGVSPLATLLAATLAAAVRAPTALTALGLVVVILALLATVKMPHIRTLA